MKLLVIEDSERLRRSLEHGLNRSGFAVDLVADGPTGLSYARHGAYDVVILDLMLPGMDGLSLLRQLRAEGNDVHVIVLSARDQVPERIQGLAHGADDYLTKPFDFDELVARIRALVRRRYNTKSPNHVVGYLTIDTEARAVTCDDDPIELTPNEYAILEYLIARRGCVVSKPEILDRLYPGRGHGSENAIEVFVHQLRKKIHREGRQDLIRTRRGHGYVIEI